MKFLVCFATGAGAGSCFRRVLCSEVLAKFSVGLACVVFFLSHSTTTNNKQQDMSSDKSCGICSFRNATYVSAGIAGSYGMFGVLAPRLFLQSVAFFPSTGETDDLTRMGGAALIAAGAAICAAGASEDIKVQKKISVAGIFGALLANGVTIYSLTSSGRWSTTMLVGSMLQLALWSGMYWKLSRTTTSKA